MQLHRMPRRKGNRPKIPRGWEKVWLGPKEHLKAGDYILIGRLAERILSVEAHGPMAFVGGRSMNVALVKFKLIPRNRFSEP